MHECLMWFDKYKTHLFVHSKATLIVHSWQFSLPKFTVVSKTVLIIGSFEDYRKIYYYLCICGNPIHAFVAI